MEKSKLKWTGKEKVFKPTPKVKPEFTVQQDLKAQRREAPGPRYELYLTDMARRQIWDHIEFGKQTPGNFNEQGGILLGNIYHDKEKGIYYGLVNHALAGVNAQGNPSFLQMGKDVWHQMISEADRLQEQSEEELQLIGWYHTHPNQLDVFMSGTDVQTQQKWFRQDWHFAMVINPHRKIWRVFHGPQAEECEGHCLAEGERLPNKEQAAFNEPIQVIGSNNNTAELSRIPEDGRRSRRKSSRKDKQKKRGQSPFRKSLGMAGIAIVLLITGFLLGWSTNTEPDERSMDKSTPLTTSLNFNLFLPPSDSTDSVRYISATTFQLKWDAERRDTSIDLYLNPQPAEVSEELTEEDSIPTLNPVE